MTRSLTLPHTLLALAVMAIWGSNFVVMKFALSSLPPLFFGAARFVVVVVPAILFVRRPAVPWRRLAAYGAFIGGGQFALMYIAVSGFISPGLASLLAQTQVFFTIALAVAGTGERVTPPQVAAVLLAASGIALIAVEGGGEATPLGIALVLGAGFFWALGNTVARKDPGADMLGYVVWSSLFAFPLLVAASLVFEGPGRIASGLAAATPMTWAAVAWQSAANSLFGYTAWGFLLARYPAATVAPMSLLVPVFGIGASVWWLGEPLPGWKLAAGLLVLAGLALNLLWPRLAARLAAPGT